MDRKSQLSNVAFGGDWSEAIAPGERTQICLDRLTAAVEACQDEDPLMPEVIEALDWLSGRVSRGEMLRSAFVRSCRHPVPEIRQQELWRSLRTIRSLVGAAASKPS